VFAVVFEVSPHSDRFDDYLALAKQLRPTLEKMDGFIENERFKSRSRSGWVLSHSAWRDEKAVIRWRTLGEHHQAQQRGRDEILDDYRLRVGDVTADSDGPVQEQRFDTTEISSSTTVTLTEIAPQSDDTEDSDGAPDTLSLVGLPVGASEIDDHDSFTSINTPGNLAVLISWSDPRAAAEWAPAIPSPYAMLRHRVVRVIRDYAKYDRREAPQYYPDAAGRETHHAS
jgi:heme-degrading monooxygenase HmoA